jgi:hypothetical protein
MKFIKRSKITTNFISTRTDLSVFFSNKLINNQKFLNDLIEFIKTWLDNNPDFRKYQRPMKKKTDKNN